MATPGKTEPKTPDEWALAFAQRFKSDEEYLMRRYAEGKGELSEKLLLLMLVRLLGGRRE